MRPTIALALFEKADIPTDPFLLVSALEVIATGDLAMGATGGDPGGFKYDSQTGKIIINIAAEEKKNRCMEA